MTHLDCIVREAPRLLAACAAAVVLAACDAPATPAVAAPAPVPSEPRRILWEDGVKNAYPHWSAAMKGLSIRGWVFTEITRYPHRFDRAREAILTGLADGHLKPVIAKTFAFDDLVEAHRYLEANQQVGKVVVTM